ncbi:MAG: ATP-dependent DNA helicase [Candidatus Aenigmarchaeota archaeon]|nr:ATP-dependent DNA helicase [Candidatus Aenigmarchaeota archaeon]
MLFPFPNIRPVQQQFMSDVRNAVETSSHLMAHAPTGLGKTAGTLAPALEYALGSGKTVLFLTPRHSQHAIAIETLQKMRNRNDVAFQVADIIGKKWLCNVAGVEELATSEFNDFCNTLVREERCKFYNETRTEERLLTARASSFLNVLNNRFYHAEEVKERATEFCPYEIVTDMARKSTVIIADYYHIFSPARGALLTRIRKTLDQLIVVVDEAHNLPERIRSLMSQKLSTFALEKAVREARLAGFSDAAAAAEDVRKVLDHLKRQMLAAERETYLSREQFIDVLENRLGPLSSIISTLSEAGDEIRKERKKSYVASVGRFLDAWSNTGPGYTRILRRGRTRSGRPFASIIYTCLDPAVMTKDVFDSAHSSILMSGTLLPMDMYRDVLGLPPERTALRSYPSPFPKMNRLNVVIRDTTTRFSKRTDETYSRIAQHVVACANAIPGNCAAFFPSYSMRDRIYALLGGRVGKHVMLEKQDATKKERRDLYHAFIAQAGSGALLMGVSAGSFSEGIDLPGTFLNGVIVVGIPLERPSLESKALIDYYDLKFSRGWDYGSAYPAMNRCLQAAGRAIRSETDRGVCVFIDERFLWGNYRKVFPPDILLRTVSEPEALIRAFWNSN